MNRLTEPTISSRSSLILFAVQWLDRDRNVYSYRFADRLSVVSQLVLTVVTPAASLPILIAYSPVFADLSKGNSAGPSDVLLTSHLTHQEGHLPWNRPTKVRTYVR